MSRKIWVGLGVAVALLGLVGCSSTGPEEPAESSQQEGSSQQPDLEGVPDVVAEVNGVEITKDEFVSIYEMQFTQWQMQAQQTGEALDQDQLRTQTAEAMVDSELLSQEADERKIELTQNELDSALEQLAAANQMGSTDELLAALKEQGMGEEEVYAELEMQQRVDRLLTEEVGDTEPTEQELREIYDQAVAQQEQSGGEALPTFEEVKPQIVEQAVNTKKSEAYQALAAQLREEGEITLHL
ncbi:SurA N-terminal domain-containing protein [Microbacterium sp. A94]|uniref:SurA N-terminal domain-containing protein n=1 Tax=Microbacterium sp. A94 TaxID=3450717 RepID=UPI003F42A56B